MPVAMTVLVGGTVGAYASDVQVTFYSTPPGAMLIEPRLDGGSPIPAPLKLRVRLGKDKGQADPQHPGGYCRQVGPMTARWQSGAEATATLKVRNNERKNQ